MRTKTTRVSLKIIAPLIMAVSFEKKVTISFIPDDYLFDDRS